MTVELPKDPTSDPQFKEEVISLLREQKDKVCLSHLDIILYF